MKTKYSLILIVLVCTLSTYAQSGSRIKLNDTALMHEMRSTPSPLNNAIVSDRNVSFQWPLSNYDTYYMEDRPAWKKPKEDAINYRIRFSKDPGLKKGVINANTSWPFYNPEQVLSEGVWYWQFGYVNDNKTEWSDLLQFEVEANPDKFNPPAYKTVILSEWG